jgi:hypothetical protein
VLAILKGEEVEVEFVKKVMQSLWGLRKEGKASAEFLV